MKNFRVPIDASYVASVGQAVYLFAYYEWAIIWLIDFFEPGFVHEYSRGRRPLTSRRVEERLGKCLSKWKDSYPDNVQKKLAHCQQMFSGHIVERNALIHAHPITDSDNAQILAYQTDPSKPLPDMKWPSSEVVRFVASLDEAASTAVDLLYELRALNDHYGAK